jgi:hypothetical protein
MPVLLSNGLQTIETQTNNWNTAHLRQQSQTAMSWRNRVRFGSYPTASLDLRLRVPLLMPPAQFPIALVPDRFLRVLCQQVRFQIN